MGAQAIMEPDDTPEGVDDIYVSSTAVDTSTAGGISINNAGSTSGTYTVQGSASTSGNIYYTNSYDWTSVKSNSELLSERIDAIEDRLAILKVDEELQAKYPALKEAYDHYKLIEALVKSKGDDND